MSIRETFRQADEKKKERKKKALCFKKFPIQDYCFH